MVTLLHLSETTEVYILIPKEETLPLAKTLKLSNIFTVLKRYSKQATSLGWYKPQINNKQKIPLNAMKQNRVIDWAVKEIYMQYASHTNLRPISKCCHYWLQIWCLFQWESICRNSTSCFYSQHLVPTILHTRNSYSHKCILISTRASSCQALH